MKFRKNAFTLIELLAVIVILAIIAVIATPLAINVINDSREKSFINSTYGLIDGAKLLSAEQLFDDGSNEVVVNFTDGTADNTHFKVSGDMPNSGTIHLNSDGKIELKVWSEELGKCAEKGSNEAEVELTETTKENCKIEVSTSVGKTFTEIMEPLLGTEVRDDGTADHNLRYVGQSPNNYVKFNGDERWRIIGLFDGQVKIIRNDYFELDDSIYIQWDSNSSNNWATASLNLLWNDDEDGTSYIRSIQSNDPTSYSYIDLEHVWNIGGSTSTTSTWTRESLYQLERGTTPAKTSGSMSTWTGAIGLMYPSDYGYASSLLSSNCDSTMYDWYDYLDCYESSWLYDSNDKQWTLTPLSDYSSYVFYLHPFGDVGTDSTNSAYTARPVLYLKSNVKIVDGLGTDQQPYILGT